MVQFEQVELGNNYGIRGSKLNRLKKYPVDCIKWFTKKRKDAKRYGEPVRYILTEYEVIAEDGEGGYLILTKQEVKCQEEKLLDAIFGKYLLDTELKITPDNEIVTKYTTEAGHWEEKTKLEKRG